MRKICAAAGLFLALSGSVLAQSKQDFVLVNKTGYQISEVYVSASKSNDWEDDVLGDKTLDDGEFLRVKFSGVGKTCKWDIKVVYSDDDSNAVWDDVDLCATSKVTIRYNRKTDKTSASFD